MRCAASAAAAPPPPRGRLGGNDAKHGQCFVSAVGAYQDNGRSGRGADFARGRTKDGQMKQRRGAATVNYPPMNASRTPQMNQYSFRRSIKVCRRVILGLIDLALGVCRAGLAAAARSWRRTKG